MRASVRCLDHLSRLAARGQSTSFIGLGRMGFEMANNLFSKQYADSPHSHFVVCDALPETAQSFRDAFFKQYPQAKMTVASTPEEYGILTL